MGYAGGGAAATAGAAVALAQAIKASGAIVRVEPESFAAILERTERPLVVCAAREKRWILPASFQYLTGYRGLVFYTKVDRPLRLPDDAELVAAKQIWVPA